MISKNHNPGRNDPCPCGSGIKYKKCCLLNQVPTDETVSVRHEGIKTSVEKLEECLAQHNSRRYKELTYKYYIANKLRSEKKRDDWSSTYAILCALQNCLTRSELLIKGIIEALHSSNYLIALLAIRAHYETLGAVAFSLREIKKFAVGSIDHREIFKVALKLHLGKRIGSEAPGFAEYFLGRDYKDEPLQTAYGVLTFVDAADKMIAAERRDICFRENYDLLSEYCHPNSHGLNLGISHRDVNQYEAFVRQGTANESISYQTILEVVNHVILPIDYLISFYDEAYNLLSLDKIKAIEIKA
jgi:hypothetical protein